MDDCRESDADFNRTNLEVTTMTNTQQARPSRLEQKATAEQLVRAFLSDGKVHFADDVLALPEVYGKTIGDPPSAPQAGGSTNWESLARSALKYVVNLGEAVSEGRGKTRTVRMPTPPRWARHWAKEIGRLEVEARAKAVDLLGQGEGRLLADVLKSLQEFVRSKLGPSEDMAVPIPEAFPFALAWRAVRGLVREGLAEVRAVEQPGGPAEELRLAQAEDAAGPAGEQAERTADVREGANAEGSGNGAAADEPAGQTESSAEEEQGADDLPADADQPEDQSEDAAAPRDDGGVDPQGEDASPSAGAAPGRFAFPVEARFLPKDAQGEVAEVDIDDILDDDSEEPLQEVPGMAESLGDVGMLQPPCVRPGPAPGKYQLVFGRRRVREQRKKGKKSVVCLILPLDDAAAEMAAIDETLVRSEPTLLERMEMLQRRKELHEQQHPEAARPQGGRPRNGATVAPFSEEVAPKADLSRRTVQDDVAIVAKLSPQTRDKLRGTDFADSKAVLRKLAKMPPREQLATAAVLARGQAKTVAAAAEVVEGRKRARAGQAAEESPGAAGPATAAPSGGPSFEVLAGDCLELLPQQPPGRFRLVVADPPQNQGVDYGEGGRADRLADADYLAWTRRWLEACVPLLTDDGSLWLITGDPHVHACSVLLGRVGLHPRGWVKVYEPAGAAPAKGFARSSFHLLYATRSAERFVFHAAGLTGQAPRGAGEARALEDLGWRPTDDVWIVPRLRPGDGERVPWFPAQRRLALVQPVVLCATDEGDWVLDPFCGSASAGVAALGHGRNYVGMEKNTQYAELARGRLAARAGRTEPAPAEDQAAADGRPEGPAAAGADGGRR
jgi:modification methylase